MKKFLLTICLALLMVSFYGCGKAPEAGETSEETTTEEVEVTDTLAEEAEIADTLAEETAEEAE